MADRIGKYLDHLMIQFDAHDFKNTCKAIYYLIRGDEWINGQNPRTLAGCVFYIAMMKQAPHSNITQKHIAKSLDISVLAIRNYIKLYHHYKHDIDFMTVEEDEEE